MSFSHPQVTQAPKWALWTVHMNSLLLISSPIFPLCQSFRLNMLQHSVPTGCSSFKVSAPAWSSIHPRIPLPSEHIHLLPVVSSTDRQHGPLYGLQGNHLCHLRLPRGLWGNLCSGAWSSSSTSLRSQLGIHKVVCPTCFVLTTLCAAFLPFLPHTVPTVRHPSHRLSCTLCRRLDPAGTGCVQLGQPWPRLSRVLRRAVGSGWIRLDPVGSSCVRLCPAGAALASLHGATAAAGALVWELCGASLENMEPAALSTHTLSRLAKATSLTSRDSLKSAFEGYISSRHLNDFLSLWIQPAYHSVWIQCAQRLCCKNEDEFFVSALPAVWWGLGPRKDVVRRPPWLVQAQTAPLIAPLAWTCWSGMALPGKMWSVHDYKALGAMVKGWPRLLSL